MCGRFTYLFSWKQLHQLMELADWPTTELSPRYNVAPTQDAPIVRARDGGSREGALLRWGLVPSWAKEPEIGNRLINARGESVAEKPAFRTAFVKRRCLVPISGFYEWKKPSDGGKKQPFLILRKDREPFMLAGLWERWTKGDEPLETFTIITTEANSLLAPLHDRMPVILKATDFARWLDPRQTNSAKLSSLLKPAAVRGFEAYPISTRINNPRNEGKSLIEPVEVEQSDLFGD